MSELQVKRASIPSEGIYYAVPKERNMDSWTILFQRIDEVDSKQTIHYLFWMTYVKDYLMKLGLNENEWKIIENLYRGLPRGRISKDENNNWNFEHGNDTPNSVEHLIYAEFGLLRLLYENKVNKVFVTHESMIHEHKEIVYKIIKE